MKEEGTNPAGIYQTLMVLWGALTISQLLFIVMIYFTKPELFSLELKGPTEHEAFPILLVLGFVALCSVAASFVVRRRSSNQAATQQSPVVLQTGLILAMALCEAATLFGLITAFAFNYQYFFLWIALGVFASLLHIPRFNEVLGATYKRDFGNDNGIQ